MKRNKSEMIDLAKKILGERTDDDAISFLEDVSDSFTDTTDEWEKKYNAMKKEKEDLDASWRKRYTDRFHGNSDSDEHDSDNDHEDNDNGSEDNGTNTKITINDLFKEEE